MMILLYIVTILVWIVLGRQERRHAFEIALEFGRLGKPVPPVKPKLTMVQSVLNIVVGIVVVGFGVLFTWVQLRFIGIVGEKIRPEKLNLAEGWLFIAFLLASGFALIIIGIKSVLRNRAYKNP